MMMTWVMVAGLLLCVGLGIVWAKSLGILRASSAALCRAGWLIPVICTLVPETITESVPNVLLQQPIHILVDDSVSMRGGRFGAALDGDVQRTLKEIDETCLQVGCLPKVVKLSEMRPETAKGFTPLSAVVEPWLFKTGAEPWVLLSDGADWRPSKLWSDRLRGRGVATKERQQGLVVSYGKPAVPGFWLEDLHAPSFAFEGRSTQVQATIARASKGGVETVQVQVSIDAKAISSVNAVFADGAIETQAEINFASPSRGPHLLTVKVLPVSGEKDIWDNELNSPLDVLPNTLGVLHLLGAPSWDGRFLRRYLKAEPKFDLISFFILRDPWDSQQVNERELSLIPFPVDRLFKEELASFRVLVIQNFTMQQFLQPEYQTNLVKFVQNGGGLLFIGGPRALTQSDIANSPMAEILPFTLQDGAMTDNAGVADGRLIGGTYDPQAKFTVEMAHPDLQKRALANVYDDWERLSLRLGGLKSMSGLHRMSSFRFKQDAMTPLLNAKTANGTTVPLAVASYPGKGRALWLFSDNLWRIGMSGDGERSRFDYQEFMDGALTWLMRNDRKASLMATDFSVENADDDQSILWRVRVTGPAARFVGASGGDWSVSVCGRSISAEKISTEQHGSEEWTLSGSAMLVGRSGSLCAFKIQGEHPAFGSVTASALTVFSDTLSDENMSPSPRKLRQLSEVTGAKFVAADADRSRLVGDWLRSWTSDQGASMPNRFRTIRDFYWVHRRPWIWLVLFLLPLEILIRRWHLLAGRGVAVEAEEQEES